MATTDRLALPLLAAAQAQKHVWHNEALGILDGLVHLAVADRDLSAPPEAPAEGARYIIGPAPTGAWAGRAGALAEWTQGSWRYHQPQPGWRAFVADEQAAVIFDGAAWIAEQALVRTLQSLERLGLGTTADASNPLSAKLNGALLTATTAADGGSGDLRLTLNKEGSAATGSLIFQSGFSGRAEIGLAGDDDLRVKVSADGSAWKTALAVSRASGSIAIPSGSAAGPSLAVIGDANTGLFAPGADTLALATGGVERLRVGSTGLLGLGAVPVAGDLIRVGAAMSGATTARGVTVVSEIQPSVTGFAHGFLSNPSTAAASFTLGSLRHFAAVPGTFGAGSTVTNQFGLFVADLTGASNNYGVYTLVSAGSQRWNIYAAGTAANHFAGSVGIGTTAPAEKLTVAGHIAPATDNAHSLGTASLRASAVYAATGTINTSDAREKTAIAPSALGLDFILRLTPRSYRWRVGGYEPAEAGNGGAADGVPLPREPRLVPRPGRRRHHGLLAHEVKAVLDELGVEDFAGYVLADADDPDSRQGLRYDQFIAPLIRAVQELAGRVAALERAQEARA